MEIENLKQFLSKGQADFEIIYHGKPIKSRKDALEYFKLEETAPTLIIKSEITFYALIISGKSNKIDLSTIQGLLGCKELKMASKYEVLEKINVEIGRVPLIGHNLPCIIDNAIFDYKYVYGGTGDFNHTLKIKPRDVVRLNETILQYNPAHAFSSFKNLDNLPKKQHKI